MTLEHARKYVSAHVTGIAWILGSDIPVVW
jgi:hypothetical protein